MMAHIFNENQESVSSNLPTIVVVDSSKAPDEQRRTQITLYKPELSPKNAPGRGIHTRQPRVLRRLDSSKSKISSLTTLATNSKATPPLRNGNGAVVGTAITVPSAGKARLGNTTQQQPSIPNNQGIGSKVRSSESRKVVSRRRALKQGPSKKRQSPTPSPKLDKRDILIEMPNMEPNPEDPYDKPIVSDVVVISPDGTTWPEPEVTPEITITDTADDETRRLPSPTPSEEDDSESREVERLKNQIRENLKPRDPKKDKAQAALVVQAFKNHVSNRRPTKVENKWHLWKYAQYEKSRTPRTDWLEEATASGSSDVGWGRRIYDKNEIESDDRERERIQLDETSTRHLNMKTKQIPELYGLWDNIYDRRVIRTLDCNAKWVPNRKEVEKRKKKDKSKSKKEKRDKEIPDPDDPFAESRKKWIPTGDELTEDDLEFCLHHTNYPAENIAKWFRGFRQTCPNGKLTKAHLHGLFKQIFPSGNSETFCNHIFRIFDNDGNGFLDFKEFLMALDVASCRSDEEKLQWAFRLYDVDSSGSINLKEIAAIMETMEQVEGRKEVSSLTMTRRAAEIFGKLDDDNDGEITMPEFVQGYLRMREGHEASGIQGDSSGYDTP